MRMNCSNDLELGSTVLVAPEGSLDSITTPVFLEEVTPHVTAGTPSLLLDLGHVDWMSSAGVGALVRLLARTQSLGGGVALFGCNSRVRTILRVCGLEKVLNVRETAAEARARLQEVRPR